MPQRSPQFDLRGQPAIAKNALLIIVGFALICLSTVIQFPLPGTSIPQTAQTIAVLCAGAILGPVLGGGSVALYLIAGALGLPVFSDGGSGITHLSGASAGYLFGFVIAAGVMGVCRNKGLLNKKLLGFLCLLIGHMIILCCGWAWMSTQVGMTDAYQQGVAPFYYGSVGKSLLALLTVIAVSRVLSRQKNPD
ncbi:MAG: biotin transporter BioY [SAR86 cluster bacterium]|uniref:Biotin transporter n=1 Tax=SAR86 cluster bacterium TaxID=2030880 RepID=A0A2A4MPQ1_9GAMM|nr:MAG: biotin transporter BioY [SAR86 cluster bacterium]